MLIQHSTIGWAVASLQLFAFCFNTYQSFDHFLARLTNFLCRNQSELIMKPNMKKAWNLNTLSMESFIDLNSFKWNLCYNMRTFFHHEVYPWSLKSLLTARNFLSGDNFWYARISSGIIDFFCLSAVSAKFSSYWNEFIASFSFLTLFRSFSRRLSNNSYFCFSPFLSSGDISFFLYLLIENFC